MGRREPADKSLKKTRKERAKVTRKRGWRTTGAETDRPRGKEGEQTWGDKRTKKTTRPGR